MEEMNRTGRIPAIVSNDLFQEYCDHVFWSNRHPVPSPHFKEGSLVFCKIDAVLLLFEKLRLTRKRIILLTGEGDFPCDAFRQQFLPKNVLHWFSTNVTHPHPRVSAIPLGLGSPSDPITLKMADLLKMKEKNIPKSSWLLVSFRAETNRSLRQPIYEYFQERSEKEPWITFYPPNEEQSKDSFLEQLSEHRFLLSPPGNGVDTHRIWEALAIGSYPIVLTSEAMRPFEELPILMVHCFEEITLPFLEYHLPQLEEKRENLFLLEMSYWEKKLQEAKKNVEKQPRMEWKEWFEESIHYGLKMLQRRSRSFSLTL